MYCETCDCTVAYANWYHHRHFFYDCRSSEEKYCNICRCYVLHANWDQHINGRRHLDNDDSDSDCSYDVNSDSDCSVEMPGAHTLPVGHIYYNQDSIAPEFRDGTTLTQGILNLKELVPEWNRQDSDWGGVRPPYVIDVFGIDGLRGFQLTDAVLLQGSRVRLRSCQHC